MSHPPSHVPAEIARRQAEEIFRAWGMPEAALRTTAHVLIETDLSGVDSHGIAVIPMYDQMRREGKLNIKAAARIARQSSTTALIDADAGLGHPAGTMAMELAIEKALAHDIAAVTVFNSHHFGAAGYYAEMAAKRGLIGMVSSSTRFVSVVPTRAAEPVLGTNPLAFAAPAGRHPPVVLDMATSVVAINKIKVYARREQELPPGWVIDGDGGAVTNPEEALRWVLERPEGGVNPIGGSKEMGGHKGYGLSLFAHILGGTLPGSSFSPVRLCSQGPDVPENIGHFFLALNPAAFRPLEDFQSDMDVVIDALHNARPAHADQPVLVAGDPERQCRAERTAHGIPMEDSLKAQIRDVAASAGAPFLLA